MNTANKITMTRVLMIPVFIVLLYTKFEVNIFITNVSIALLVFIGAAITDIIDGVVARNRNQITDFGKFMDPLADKLLTFAAMLWFIEVGFMPAWLVFIVILREFMVTGIRLVAAAKSTVIAASIYGKIKTIVTISAIIAMFVLYMELPVGQWIPIPWELISSWMLIFCWTLIGTTTVISGVEYLITNREIMRLDK